MTTLRTAVAEAARTLRDAGVPSARHDAEVLAALALGVDLGRLWLQDRPGPGFPDFVARRAAREPLQHITGRAGFRHLDLAVGPGVFVPRPETEVVAGAAVQEARRLGGTPVVVDLGTGSGAIALAVADEVPGAEVHAVEVSPAALAWARRNLAAHPRGGSVDLRPGDMAGAFPDLDGRVDVVVSNPPYIPVGAVVRDPEVAAYDPPEALWSGPDGLAALQVVERVAARLLRPGGLAVVEHADAQGQSGPAVFTATGRWTDVADRSDLAGRPRFVTARRAGVAAGPAAGQDRRA